MPAQQQDNENANDSRMPMHIIWDSHAKRQYSSRLTTMYILGLNEYRLRSPTVYHRHTVSKHRHRQRNLLTILTKCERLTHIWMDSISKIHGFPVHICKAKSFVFLPKGQNPQNRQNKRKQEESDCSNDAALSSIWTSPSLFANIVEGSTYKWPESGVDYKTRIRCWACVSPILVPEAIRIIHALI